MTQLERLARPFPPKYVKAPAKGKYGSYVPHDVVQQALLAILGPVNIDIGQVFMGESGKIEGCLVTMSAPIDGQFVRVTEVGDCENPDNWKTQGARMKDAISDGIKRCAMRLGLGLHLWAQEDYFLYDQLQGKPSMSSGVVESDPSASTADAPASEPSPPSSPPEGGTAGDSGSGVPFEPGSPAAIPASRMQRAKSRVGALLAAKVSVADERTKRLLPPLNDEITAEEFDLFCAMLDDLEAKLPV